MSLRDTQKSKVYRSEHAAWSALRSQEREREPDMEFHVTRNLSMDEVRAAVVILLSRVEHELPRLARAAAGLRSRGVVVQDGRGRRSACARYRSGLIPSTLHFPVALRDMGIVCHEVALLLVRELSRGWPLTSGHHRLPHHGPLFVTVLRLLVELQMGEAAADALRAAQRRLGVVPATGAWWEHP